jgi:multidrug efflux pump
VISKVEADAQAIMWLAFASDRHSALKITDYAERYVKDRLQSLPGVASVAIALFHPRPCALGITTGWYPSALV